MSDLLKLAGLWKSSKAFAREDQYTEDAFALVRSGKPFKFVLLKNDNKEGNQPDLKLFVAPAEDAPGKKSEGSYPDDDVPF